MIWIVATGAIDIANDSLITLSILIDFENCKLKIMTIIDAFVFNKTMKLWKCNVNKVWDKHKN